MSLQPHDFPRRIESIRLRLDSLDSLKKMVALKRDFDLSDRQWAVLQSHLVAEKTHLLSKLKKGARKYLPEVQDPKAARSLNALLGEAELEMSRAFVLFDTYADVLTQRHSPELGPLLAGCDVLARDALNKDNPALSLIEPPVVYCDRGFGASTLREGVLFPNRIPNPLPLIQIPYSRLKEKHNLTSILHEAGHEAMVRLNLVKTLPMAFSQALEREGAPDDIRELFALWTSEIGPDFWTFCCSGIAQPGTLKEILALPSSHVFRVSWTDPHPPPYLRVLLSIECCRQVWGSGIWDKWETEWKELYPLEEATRDEEKILNDAIKYLHPIARVLLRARFKALCGKTIPSLFDMSKLSYAEGRIAAKAIGKGSSEWQGFSPCAVLSIFRLIREENTHSEEIINKLMTEWIIKLGNERLNKSQ